MYIHSHIFDKLISHCKLDPTKESCGLLFGEGKMVDDFHPAINMSEDPHAYTVDPESTLQLFDKKFLGVYHSHIFIPPVPSNIDLQQANLPGKYYIIYSLKYNQLRSWLFTGKNFVAVPTKLV